MNVRPETSAQLRTPLAILDLRAIEGPNLFHGDSVIVLRLDPGAARDWRSHQEPRFAEHLLISLPGLAAHPGKGRGLAERLARGVSIGDVVAAVALELARLARIESAWGRAFATDEPGNCLVVVQCREQAGMRVLLEGAVALVDALLDGRPVSAHETVAGARRLIAHAAPASGMQAIIDAAAERNIPCRRIDPRSGLMRLGWGSHARWIDALHCGSTGLLAARTAADKALAMQLLREACIAAPRGRVVHSAEAAMQALEEFTPPLVLKPASGPHRRHVALRITTPAEAAAAYSRAALIDRRVLVEEQARGRDYRVLVVAGKLAAASERVAAQVVGDGSSTIERLIERENAKRRANHGDSEPAAGLIRIDEAVQACLAGRGVWLDSVPAAATRVALRETASLASGGTAIDVTAVVHPDVAALCVRAAQVIGLDVCGIDVVSPDIARAGGAAIVEVQAAPSLEMHCRPSAGEPRQVGKAIIEMLYPGEGASDRRDARIPLVAIAGAGDSGIAEFTGQLLGAPGRSIGLAGCGGLWIGERKVAEGDGACVRALLANPGVDLAVVELAHDAVARDGLGYDWCDVAVLHAPAGEALTRLVAAQVRRGGTLVANADTMRADRIADLTRLHGAGRRLICYAEDAGSPCLREHLASGGHAVAARDGWIVALTGHGAGERLVALDALPAPCTGRAPALCAALAAIAVQRALSLR